MEYLAQNLGVPYLRLPELGRELSLPRDLAATRSLRRVLRKQAPDVLHTHTAKAGAVGRLAALLCGRRRPRAVVHTYHGHVLSGYFSPRRERIFRLAERALAYVTDMLIAVSNEVRDDLVELRVAPREKFVVIPYGFDPVEPADASSEERTAQRALAGAVDSFAIGWAGRLTEIKRPHDLIRVVAQVDDARLIIVGDGELRADVERLARDLDVADRVLFLGYVRDMRSWYAAFDIFLLTSLNEGTPVVAIEALSAGVPVVATSAGGTNTVVDDGETGLLAEVGDVDALAEHERRLRDDPDLRARMGTEGARRMRERFSPERMVDDVERLYRRILAS
jgi:glycosyltransferase involved in cell wall biosynthesis